MEEELKYLSEKIKELQITNLHEPNDSEIAFLQSIFNKLKTTYYISEEIFYNKELSDSIRKIVKDSPCSFEEAEMLLKSSKDYDRDTFLIIKLKCSGLNHKDVLKFLNALNN